MSNIIDINAKREPVHFTVHMTCHGDNGIDVIVEDVADDDHNKAAIAGALRRAADVIWSGSDA